MALWSHPFTFPWYFSSFDRFVSLYHLPPLTWHIREAGISSQGTSGHSKTFTITLTAWTKCSYKRKKTPVKTSRALCYSSKHCIIYRAKLLQQLIRFLMVRWNLQTSHSLLQQTTVFWFEFHATQVPRCRLCTQIIFDELEGTLDSYYSGWASIPLLSEENVCLNKKSPSGADTNHGNIDNRGHQKITLNNGLHKRYHFSVSIVKQQALVLHWFSFLKLPSHT